jgi:hypothetical protein
MRNGVNVIDKENILELIAARENLLSRSVTQITSAKTWHTTSS